MHGARYPYEGDATVRICGFAQLSLSLAVAANSAVTAQAQPFGAWEYSEAAEVDTGGVQAKLEYDYRLIRRGPGQHECTFFMLSTWGLPLGGGVRERRYGIHLCQA